MGELHCCFFSHLSKMWTGAMCLKLARTEYSESAPTHFCLSEVLTHFAFQASNPTSSFCVLIISMNNPAAAACIHTSILQYNCISLASSCALIWATWQFLWIWKLDQHTWEQIAINLQELWDKFSVWKFFISRTAAKKASSRYVVVMQTQEL